MTRSANLFPPGLAVRTIRATDNEAVRLLFILGQDELVSPGTPLDVRLAVKKYTDSCLMDDLARASHHYSHPRRRFWVVESEGGTIAAMAAIDSADEVPGISLLRRLVVSPDFRRKGVARLLVQRAEQWMAQQGFHTLRLDVTDLQPPAIALYRSMEFEETKTFMYGPITVFEIEKAPGQ